MVALEGFGDERRDPIDEPEPERTSGGESRVIADGPRERLLQFGAGSLSESDLLALVLRTGDAERGASKIAGLLIDRFGGARHLGEESLESLLAVPGIGPAKGASLTAAFELGRRSLGRVLKRGARIQSPRDVQRHFQGRLREWRRESFHVVLLDGRHRLIAVEAISLGTLTASLVHPREVFRDAIRRAAAAVLLVHNHPSGDPSPSQEDRVVTRRLEAAGELLGIRVLDHVIVAEDGYFSFREQDPEFGTALDSPGANRVVST